MAELVLPVPPWLELLVGGSEIFLVLCGDSLVPSGPCVQVQVSGGKLMEGNHFCAVDGGVLMVRVMELPQAAVGDNCLGLVELLLSYISSDMEFYDYECLMQWTFIGNPNLQNKCINLSFLMRWCFCWLPQPRSRSEFDYVGAVEFWGTIALAMGGGYL